MIDGPKLARRLTSAFSLNLVAEGEPELSATPTIRVVDIEPPNGFGISISSTWRSLEARFSPDPFAGQLVKSLCTSSELQRNSCFLVASAFKARGVKSTFKIDGDTVDFGPLPPGEWRSFSLSCLRLTSHDASQADAEDVTTACLSLVLSLLTSESVVSDIAEPSGSVLEGKATRQEVTRYERSPVNRAAAISLHGAICKACGFDFAKVYGAIGDGFIEVHHITPVSDLGGPVLIDPLVDLVPLCSNCHRMVHRQDPPISVDELRSVLARCDSFAE
jgi:5-methylcytosine-specific restriction protein A